MLENWPVTLAVAESERRNVRVGNVRTAGSIGIPTLNSLDKESEGYLTKWTIVQILILQNLRIALRAFAPKLIHTYVANVSKVDLPLVPQILAVS